MGALSDKEIACTTKVMFTQNLDDLKGHHCLEDVLDYTTDTNYINTKSACDNAKSDLIAANEVLDLAEERSACASEKAYYFWMKAEGLTFRNFQGCKLGTKVLTKNREYTDQPTNRSTNRPTNRPTNRSTNRSTNRPTNRSTNRPTNSGSSEHLRAGVANRSYKYLCSAYVDF